MFLRLYKGLFLVFLLFLKAISLLVRVRFGRVYSGRIGHLALDFDIYNCDRLKSPWKYRRTIDILVLQEDIANRYLLYLWRTKCAGYFILSDRYHWVGLLETLNRRFQIYRGLFFDLERRDSRGLTIGSPRLIELDQTTEESCKNNVAWLGIREKFVCIHNRDIAYETVNEFRKKGDPNYHDYRNSSIQNYTLAAAVLIERQYSIVRIGRTASERFPSMENAFDYAFNHSDQSDEMDIYLASSAAFVISTCTGLSHLPFIFRKQQLTVNVIPFLPSTLCAFSPLSIILPKKLWFTTEKRFLSFSEAMRFVTTVHNTQCPFRKCHLEPIENTPEEIRDAAIEMDDHLNGRSDTYVDLGDLQMMFWGLAPSTPEWHTVKSKFRFRIGSTFLYNNRDLIR